MKRPVIAVCLAALYLLALGSVAPLDVAFAAAVGTGVTLATTRRGRRRLSLPDVLRRGAGLPRLLLRIALDAVDGTWRMALVVLGLRPWRRLGIIEVPIDDRTELGLTVTTLAAMLSPGTLLVDVDRERRVMVFHVIDRAREDELREQIQRFYRDYQRQVFP